MIGGARFGLKRLTGSFELSMADYETGYGKPPRHRQFKKGVAPTREADPGVATLKSGTSCKAS